MIACSINAGVVSRSRIREKLNKIGFSQNIIISDNNYVYFEYFPSNNRNCIIRHLYKYNRVSDTFNFLGCQRAQSVKKYTSGSVLKFDNTTLSGLNNNKIYSNIEYDNTLTDQANINTADIYLRIYFNARNLYDGQVVFIDTSWVIRNYVDNLIPFGGTISRKRGNPYRIGIISDPNTNTVDQMNYKVISDNSIFTGPDEPVRTSSLVVSIT